MLNQRWTATTLALTVAACGSGAPGPSAFAPPVKRLACGASEIGGEPKEGALRAFYPTHMRHEVHGDVTVAMDVEALIDVCEIRGDAFPPGTFFLTVSAGQFDLTLDDGTSVLWSADLVPGQYDGPGTYTIDGEEAPDIAQASGIRSAAYLRFTGPRAGDAGLIEYRELIEPCTLTIAAEAASGELSCPKLGLEGDPTRTISWTWTWERLPASAESRFPTAPATEGATPS